MECAKIRCWNRTHKKWNGNWHWESQHHRVKDGWKKAAEWNPELSSRYRTNGAIGRPRKKMGRWYQRISQTRIWRKWKPNREQQSNQQNLDQLSQRPQKMGSISGNLHNDRVRTTEVKDEDTANITKSKREWDDDNGKRSSSATLLRMHQQNEAFESSSRPAFKNFAMGWRLMVKNDVTSSPQGMKILSTKSSYQRKKIWLGIRSDWWATVPANFLFWCFYFSPSWFPWLLRCVAPNPRIPEIWIREFMPVTACVSLRVFLHFEFISWFDVLHTVHNSGFVHTLPIEQASSVQQILFHAGSWHLHSRQKGQAFIDVCWTSLSVIVIVIVLQLLSPIPSYKVVFFLIWRLLSCNTQKSQLANNSDNHSCGRHTFISTVFVGPKNKKAGKIDLNVLWCVQSEMPARHQIRRMEKAEWPKPSALFYWKLRKHHGHYGSSERWHISSCAPHISDLFFGIAFWHEATDCWSNDCPVWSTMLMNFDGVLGRARQLLAGDLDKLENLDARWHTSKAGARNPQSASRAVPGCNSEAGADSGIPRAAVQREHRRGVPGSGSGAYPRAPRGTELPNKCRRKRQQGEPERGGAGCSGDGTGTGREDEFLQAVPQDETMKKRQAEVCFRRSQEVLGFCMEGGLVASPCGGRHLPPVKAGGGSTRRNRLSRFRWHKL